MVRYGVEVEVEVRERKGKGKGKEREGKGWLTRLLWARDSGTRGLIRRESSCLVGGILSVYSAPFVGR